MPPRENDMMLLPELIVSEQRNSASLTERRINQNTSETDGELPRGSLIKSLQSNSEDQGVIEPRTGLKFPSFVTPIWSTKGSDHSMQVCAGVGLRGVSLIKFPLLKIYAFGFYINPEIMKAELGSKYGSVLPEELKLQKHFYEDLLRHELELSVRLIVHHKRVRIGMVKSAFETSLKNRLRKIKGTNDGDDEGLHAFCSYFTDDLSLPAGTVIDFQWQPGGLFHTKVGERFMGTICSLDFCRAFFDLYIGDPPVCSKAKQEIGLNLGQMFHD